MRYSRDVMAHAAGNSRTKRLTVLAAVVTGHVLAIAIVLASRAERPAPVPNPRALSLIAVDALPLPAVAAVLPSKLATPEPPPPSKPQVADNSATSMNDGPAVPACVPLDAVAKALLADQAAMASIFNAPAETRSIADAIVIWNTHWTEAATNPGDPLGPVRASVETTLSSIERNCLAEPITGPRLVPIPAGEGTTFVVFGSGAWNWSQLLPDAAATQLRTSIGIGTGARNENE